jgi:hypothetical protein
MLKSELQVNTPEDTCATSVIVLLLLWYHYKTILSYSTDIWPASQYSGRHSCYFRHCFIIIVVPLQNHSILLYWYLTCESILRKTLGLLPSLFYYYCGTITIPFNLTLLISDLRVNTQEDTRATSVIVQLRISYHHKIHVIISYFMANN